MLKNSLKEEGLEDLESIIAGRLTSEAPALTEIATYLIRLGGKRIRPVLALLSARAFGMAHPSEELLKAAAGIELIHSATLLHDDIIDNSPMRRSEVSAYRKYGLGDTLLAGDFLLVQAFGLCAQLDPFLVQITTEACVQLTEGEILETPLFKDHHTIESSLGIARKKTAALFRLAAEGGAHLAGCTRETVASMRSFGELLGIAFQVLDDVLDVTGSEDVLGKSAGIDIRERKPSIVNVLWLSTESSLSRILLTPPNEHEAAVLAECLREVLDSGVAAKAADIARDYANRARAALREALAHHNGPIDTDAIRRLEKMIDLVIERSS